MCMYMYLWNWEKRDPDWEGRKMGLKIGRLQEIGSEFHMSNIGTTNFITSPYPMFDHLYESSLWEKYNERS